MLPAQLACIAMLLPAPGQAFAASVTGSVTDGNGAPVADAVLYAMPAAATAGTAVQPGTMDQVNKEFLPLVVPIQRGALVRFPNKDNIRHHVYSFSPARPFELKLYSGTPSKPVKFDKPGPVVLGCNIHDWMVGYIYVVDTPYFAKTDKSGAARLDGLPSGEYLLHIWHPYAKVETAPRPLRLADGGAETAAFRLDLSPPQTAPANR